MRHKNKGMLLESIINRTILYYEQEGIALFHKKYLDIRLKRVRSRMPHIVDGQLIRKSTVDYYGIYQGRYIAFEAKSVDQDHFPLANIRPHQLQYLRAVEQHNGISFIILFYRVEQKFYLLYTSTLQGQHSRHLKSRHCMEIGIPLTLIYPGILDFIPIIRDKMLGE